MITNIYPVPGTDNKALGIIDDGIERFVSEGQPDWETIQTYIKEHPEVVSDPPPPPDTRDFEMQAQAEAQRQALFAAYDTAIMQLRRHERLGDETATAKIAEWDAYATALEAINDTPEWYLNPQWPEKPE
jgi:hypothetical protein